VFVYHFNLGPEWNSFHPYRIEEVVPVSIVRFTNRFVRVFAFVCAAFASLPTLAGDLQLTDYSYAPDPVANGSTATFTIRVTNNGPGTINDF
jgi:large repetitive protein